MTRMKLLPLARLHAQRNSWRRVLALSVALFVALIPAVRAQETAQQPAPHPIKKSDTKAAHSSAHPAAHATHKAATSHHGAAAHKVHHSTTAHKAQPSHKMAASHHIPAHAVHAPAAVAKAAPAAAEAPVPAEKVPATAEAEATQPAAETSSGITEVQATQAAPVPAPAAAEAQAPTKAEIPTAQPAQAQAPAATDAQATQPAAAPAAADVQSVQPPAQPSPAPDATQQPAVAEQPAAAASGDQVTVTIAPAETPATEQAAADQAAAAAQTAAPVQTLEFEIPKTGAVTEEELRHALVGKSLYLRGGYLDNSLSFDENGHLAGHSPQGSYTLSGIEIDRVHLTKHKVELEGARFGLHFLGALPYEDPTKAVDRVKITPKKKFVKITIDRELVVTPKKKKEKGAEAKKNEMAKAAPAAVPASTVFPAESQAKPESQEKPETQADAQTPDQAAKPDAPADATQPADSAAAQATKPNATPAAPAAEQAGASSAPAGVEPAAEQSDADQAKAEMAAAPEEERPAAPGSVTTTISPAHAAGVLKAALDKIFAPGLDDRMLDAMPDFWKLYYQAVAARTDYRPKDPSVLRQAAVDQKAKIVSHFEPESNDFAQNAGVAGMCLYHAVIGPDGKPGEISVARPIGFGLDEQAVAAIRKASFQPAMKGGQPVPVVLDLVVQFRIYSKRTNVAGNPEEIKPMGPILPGPYTLQDLMLRNRASN
jgi:TonB family protein